MNEVVIINTETDDILKIGKHIIIHRMNILKHLNLVYLTTLLIKHIQMQIDQATQKHETIIDIDDNDTMIHSNQNSIQWQVLDQPLSPFEFSQTMSLAENDTQWNASLGEVSLLENENENEKPVTLNSLRRKAQDLNITDEWILEEMKEIAVTAVMANPKTWEIMSDDKTRLDALKELWRLTWMRNASPETVRLQLFVSGQRRL